MNIWDMIIALSGIDDYLVQLDPDAKEVTLHKPSTLNPSAPVISIDDKRWAWITNGTKH